MELTRFDHLVLSLTGLTGVTPYELEQVCSALGLSFGYSRSHLYATPERLKRRGLVRSEKEPGSTRSRTRYALTDDGVQAVVEWLKSPAPTLALEEEIFARLAGGGDHVLYRDLANSLEASRELTEERLDDLEHLRRAMGRQYTDVPEKLAIELKLDLLRAYSRWIVRATKQLNRPGTRQRAVGPGTVHGRHHSEFVEEVKDLRRGGREDAAQRLLLDLLDAVEAEASAREMTVAPWYYKQLAVSYRKTGDTEAEIGVLERYCGLTSARGTELEKRLQGLRDRERERERRSKADERKGRGETFSKIAEARKRLRDQGRLE